MTKWILATALILMAFPSSGIAQSKDALVGTWKLVSVTDTTDKGEVKHSWGQNPTGFLTYTADGRVSAVMAFDGRKPLSTFPDVAHAEESVEALTSFVAYAGSYTVTGDKVIHHLEACSVQAWVNTDLVRFAKLQGDRLTLQTENRVVRGVPMTSEYVWERMKLETNDK
ncbi:MAG TPA: lipocalin-like domain-containing protein [Candidatus Acidoferrales bacterium]|nr:lipocalin-like domain-containing protein [Candidatus Acidoferrales bacterium]